MRLTSITVCIAITLALLTSCETSARSHYHNAEMALMAKNYPLAIEEYDKALAKEPDMVLARFGKAKALYGQQSWAEARAMFEEVLALTESDQHPWRKEREDAMFYRDRCRQELGEEVKQTPGEIPPPPMGE